MAVRVLSFISLKQTSSSRPEKAAQLWYRWILMAAVPPTIIATVRLSATPCRAIAAAIVLLLLTASLYSFQAAESAAPVFSSPITVRYLPSSMLQNMRPLRDSESIIAALEWLQDNAATDSVLPSHHTFTG